MTLAVSGAVVVIGSNPTDSYRLGRSVYYFGENVAGVFKNIGNFVYQDDPSYLKGAVVRLIDAAGVVGDVPVYGVAVAVSWIPLVNKLPIGWTWAKIRRQE